MNKRLIIYLLLVLALVSCKKEDLAQDPYRLSQLARNYLNEVLDLMEANSINRYRIDWPDFKTRVFEKVIGAETIQDVYPGIREALSLLGDNHSSYILVNGGRIFEGTLQCGDENLGILSIPENIGYVKVNSFGGTSNGADAISFAREIQDQITLK